MPKNTKQTKTFVFNGRMTLNCKMEINAKNIQQAYERLLHEYGERWDFDDGDYMVHHDLKGFTDMSTFPLWKKKKGFSFDGLGGEGDTEVVFWRGLEKETKSKPFTKPHRTDALWEKYTERIMDLDGDGGAS